MTGLGLVVLTVLFVASIASWHPDISARLEREPWWLVVGAPGVVLGLAAALMAGGSAGADGWVRGTASVLAVGVAVAGGRAVTLAMLRGAEQSGVPYVTNPTERQRKLGVTDGAETNDEVNDRAHGNGGRARAGHGDPASTLSSTTTTDPASYDEPSTVPLAAGPSTAVSTSVDDQDHQGDHNNHGPNEEEANKQEPKQEPNNQDHNQGHTETGRAGTIDAARGDDGVVLKGGTWIGALERAAVTASLLTGFTEGIVVVLAVKGLGRYPELRAPGAAERFIIGTFTSLLWAASAAGVALLVG